MSYHDDDDDDVVDDDDDDDNRGRRCSAPCAIPSRTPQVNKYNVQIADATDLAHKP